MNATSNRPRNPTVAVVGGGLAGLAAAAAASQQGLHVALFEQRKHLGGRAGSFRDPRTDQLVDHCQHLAMGCCTNLADFCRRIGVADCFRCDRRLHFIGPNGTRYEFAATGWLPAPLHLVPALMRLKYLSFGERLAVTSAMRRLARESVTNDGDRETIGAWLRRHGQSERAIQRFWSVVLVSALGETLERASLAASKKVFVDGFLTSRQAYKLEIPTIPLGEIFDRRAAAWLAEHQVAVHPGTRIRQIEGDPRRATAVVLPDGTRREFDFIIVAVPWRRVRPLFTEVMLRAMPALKGVENIQPAPITAVHLWFDRPITPLPHAVLVGRLSQWLFRGQTLKYKIRAPRPCPPPGDESLFCIRGSDPKSSPGHYCQVVISASHKLSGRKREDVLAEVRRDLEAIWPDAREATLLHWRVVTQPAAVFSVVPGLNRLRPAQQTPIENLMLAGDWTATGWPATMEGAVRSGYLAVERVLKSLGNNERVLVADLPRGWLARLLFGIA